MGHGHGSDAALHPSRRAVRLITALTLVGLGLTVVGVILLRPTGDIKAHLSGLSRIGRDYDALVERVEVGDCSGNVGPPVRGEAICRNVRVQLLAGPDEGEVRLLVLPDSPSTPDLQRGDTVVAAYAPAASADFDYSFVDRQRKPALFWLALVFALAVVVLGRLRGLAALGGLAITLVILLTFVLPAIIDGKSPVLVAIVGAACITFATLYLAHGFTHKTTTALLGTLTSLGVTALLAQAFVALSKLSGYSSDEATLLNLDAATIDIRGLVLAGIVIGALGALDDVTVTQASAVWELRAASSEQSRKDLFRAALRIGRDHIASTVNTLLLAYAGASLPLLLFFVASEQSLSSVANQEIVAVEIVRTLVGSIGLVCSVPITTWLAARVTSTERSSGTT